jgi:hypothetical protein
VKEQLQAKDRWNEEKTDWFNTIHHTSNEARKKIGEKI